MQWRIQTRHLGRQSPKSSRLHLFKYPKFSVKIVGYHAKVVTFCKPRKWLFSLVEQCDLSVNHHSLKLAYIINSPKAGAHLGVIFNKLHVTENTVGVPNNLFKQWSPTFS